MVGHQRFNRLPLGADLVGGLIDADGLQERDGVRIVGADVVRVGHDFEGDAEAHVLQVADLKFWEFNLQLSQVH